LPGSIGVISLLGHTSGTFPDVIIICFTTLWRKGTCPHRFIIPFSSSHLSIFTLPHHLTRLSWNDIITFTK